MRIDNGSSSHARRLHIGVTAMFSLLRYPRTCPTSCKGKPSATYISSQVTLCGRYRAVAVEQGLASLAEVPWPPGVYPREINYMSSCSHDCWPPRPGVYVADIVPFLCAEHSNARRVASTRHIESAGVRDGDAVITMHLHELHCATSAAPKISRG